ncbi:MAG: hypothetical protein MUP15_02630, partial [Dehalococcoidia bacterium]|nr:hypothetical protein [Dehalococcoidia bacterium]
TGVGPSESVSEIGRTGLLEFRELVTDGKGNVAVYQGDKVVLMPNPSLEDAVWVASQATGSDGQQKALTSLYLTDAFLVSDAAGLPVVDFRLDSEGAHLLEQVSTRLIGHPMAFFLDGEPIRDKDGYIESPDVKSAIQDEGQLVGLSPEDAAYLTNILKSGTFPVPFQVVGQSEFGKQ